MDPTATELAPGEPGHVHALPGNEVVVVAQPDGHTVHHHHFNPPNAVQNWLRREDMDALAKAWEEAEAQAIAWAESEDWDDDADNWNDGEVSGSASRSRSNSHASGAASGVGSSVSGQMGSGMRPARRRPVPKKEWKGDFHLVGQDTGRAAPMRRYFGNECAERSPGCPAGRMDPIDHPSKPVAHPGKALPDLAKRPYGVKSKDDFSLPSSPSLESLQQERSNALRKSKWCAEHWQTVTVDNPLLHPHFRHYFDRRGLEASYRTRPNLDKVTKRDRPRTPQKPSTDDLLRKFSASAPHLEGVYKEDGGVDVAARHVGNMPWSKRCFFHGPELNKRSPPPNEDRIPWISDFQNVVTEDNELMNPMQRHYFDKDGIESSYRNRGHHYGRPMRHIFGKHPSPGPSPKALGGSGRRPGLGSRSASVQSLGAESQWSATSQRDAQGGNTPGGIGRSPGGRASGCGGGAERSARSLGSRTASVRTAGSGQSDGGGMNGSSQRLGAELLGGFVS